MPSTDPKYLADVAALQEKIKEMKINAFDSMRHFADGYFKDPTAHGYKSAEDALMKITNRTFKEIEKEIVKLEKKYPL